jgi:hypothetical protein
MDDWESEFAKASQYVERGKSMVARAEESSGVFSRRALASTARLRC